MSRTTLAIFQYSAPRGHRYVTTLHSINSAIVKSGKLTRCTKIYRGIAGMALPKEFWTPNEYGVRGGVENGFTSTTTSRGVAMGYAGGDSRGCAAVVQPPLATILSTVHNGNDSSRTSQT